MVKRGAAPRTASGYPGRKPSGAVTGVPLPQAAVCALFLVLITLAAFWGVRSASFVSMDDDFYVTENPRVQAGLTWNNTCWAFSTTYFGYYYPLTWLSHMTDCGLYGLNAGGHHLTSLLIHTLNTLLLLAFLVRMTGALWKSFFVAALFAVHPLHVESVAWVAERKDVLSTFFWFLSILAYVIYVEKPSPARYSLVFLSFLLGLMAKPMLLTLPFTLLLLDYWPLGRLSFFKGPEAGRESGGRVGIRSLIIEKIPLFALVPIFTLVTLYSQKQASALVSLKMLPMTQRVLNSLISYASYLKKMVYPLDLSAFYPIPLSGVSVKYAAACGLFLAAVTGAVVWYGRERKYLMTGWLWYLGTLVPVSGIVQVGGQAMADRYTYVPLVGIFMMIVWGAGDAADRNRSAQKFVVAAGAAVLIILIFFSRTQAGYWKDSASLFTHALAVNPENAYAHNNLGSFLCKQGRKDEALPHFMEAVRIDPEWSIAQYNLATSLAEAGRNAEAIKAFENLLRKQVDAELLSKLGLALAGEKRYDEAISRFQEALKMKPDYYYARVNLAGAFVMTGRLDQAIAEYVEALKIDPKSVKAMVNLGLVLSRAGRASEAEKELEKALSLDPLCVEARLALAGILMERGDPAGAAEQFREALKISPDSLQARTGLSKAEASARGSSLPKGAE